MSAHTLAADLAKAPFLISDPGDGGELDLANKGRAICAIVTEGAETRTVLAPFSINQELTLIFDTDGGNCTVTINGGVSGLTTHTLTEAGQILKLQAVTVGGTLKWQVGASGGKQAALTTALTTITHTAPGTADYAIQNASNSSPYGFVTADEMNSTLAVIANLQARVNGLEDALQAAGMLA